MSNQYGLRWSVGLFHSEPVWTREPEVKVLEQIAREAFGIDSAMSVTVTFLAVGAFNKVYTVSSSALDEEYILRVSLPVDPPYKTASEVATMETVRKLTDIPVPRIIASNSNNNNSLGFEWILMEKVPGVPLTRRWRKMSWESKEKLVKQMAKFHAQLFHTRYSGIGNLHTKPRRQIKVSQDSGYASTSPKHNAKPQKRSNRIPKNASTMWQSLANWSSTIFRSLKDLFRSCFRENRESSAYVVTSNRGTGSESPTSDNTTIHRPSLFHPSHLYKSSLWSPEPVGRMVSIFFFMGDHINLDIDRGPYKTSHDWLKTRLQVTLKDQEEIIKKAEEESDDDDLEEAEFSKVNAEKLMQILPQMFPPDTKGPETTVLLHHDLHLHNIMVTDAGEIASILDWECVQCVPLWHACGIPKFLKTGDREEEPDRTRYSLDHEPFDENDPDQLDNEGVTLLYWEHLQEYDCTQLRKTYLAEMARLSPECAELHVSESATMKNDFVDAVDNCAHEIYMGIVRDWADAYLQGKPKKLKFSLGARMALEGSTRSSGS